jgi:hypothetical protein
LGFFQAIPKLPGTNRVMAGWRCDPPIIGRFQAFWLPMVAFTAFLIDRFKNHPVICAPVTIRISLDLAEEAHCLPFAVNPDRKIAEIY